MRHGNGMPSEANRYDGAPAPKREQPAPPGKEEVEAQHRRHLRSEGCKHCDEDEPDNLQQVGMLLPSCSARQKPPEPFIVLCDDCLEERPDSYAEKRVETAKEQDDVDAIVVYDCGITSFETFERPTTRGPDGDEIPKPHTRPNATVPLKCRCGATVDDIVFFDGGDE